MSDIELASAHDQQRFWRLVDKTDSCWLWTGGTVNGYGTFQIAKKNYRAHRLSFMLIRGNIPEGKHLDHLCRVRNCVNPDHLEPVTQKENIARGEVQSAIVNRTGICKNGHSMTNVYINPSSGKRRCRICFDEDNRRNNLKAKMNREASKQKEG